jgi:hypothetical protein
LRVVRCALYIMHCALCVVSCIAFVFRY